MTLNFLYNIMNPNTGITIYLNDVYAHYYETKEDIPIALFGYDVTNMGSDSDGLEIWLNVPYVSYEDLDVYAKLKAVDAYVNKLCPYDDFTDAHDLQELENWCLAFWANSEYNLDKNGNWYDEEHHCISE